MDNKTKLLAEQCLYNAAARFFEEPDCVELAQMNESKQLDEKRMQIMDPDTGKSFYADVPDSILYQAKLADDAFEELGEDDFTTAAEPAVLARRKSAAAERSAINFATRTEAGQEIFNTYIKPKLDLAIKAVAKKAVDNGVIAYDPEGQYWDASGLDYSVLRTIQAKELWPVFNQAARENGLSTVKKNLALAAYKNYLGHQANLGGDNRYNTLRRLMTKDAAELKAAKAAAIEAPVEEEPVEAPVEAPVAAPKKKRSRKKVKVESAFVKDFFKACNEVLAEEYSERYDVSLDEASKMFILNDTLYE